MYDFVGKQLCYMDPVVDIGCGKVSSVRYRYMHTYRSVHVT